MSVTHRPFAVVRSCVARATQRLGRGRPNRPPAALPILLGTVFVVYSTYALSRHRQFLTAGYDLGIFDQAIRAYSRFQPPFSALKGIDVNLLSDHFHPILVVLAPLYWIRDDPRVLLIVQAALVTAALVPMWSFARRRFGDRGGLAAVTVLAFGWPMQRLIDFDFHEIAFAVPLLAWALDALDRERDRELLAALALLLLVREDMGSVVACVGVVYALRRRRPLRGALMAAAGLLAFVLVVKVVIPAVAGRDYGYWDYSLFGSDMASSIVTIVTDPGLAITTFFTPVVKAQTLLTLLAPLLLLPLLSPISIVALPILVERFLADREALWGTGFHYNAPVWVVLCFAAVDGLVRLGALVGRRSPATRRRSATVLVLLAAVPLVGSTVLAPLGDNLHALARLTSGDAFGWTAHREDQAAILRSIPPSTCVVADDRMAGQLTRTNRVTIPGVDSPAPDYQVYDLSQPVPATTDAGWTSEEVVALAERDGYHVIERRGDMVLLAASDDVTPTPECAG